MKPRLILIEGLPGSGKSTIAQWVHEILSDAGIESEIFLEGNLDHPADYEGVAFYNKDEFQSLISKNMEFEVELKAWVKKQESDYFIPYRKMQNELGIRFPGELLNTICKNDIYELPFSQNQKLIIEKWIMFGREAIRGNKTYIFECCFIQNPVTIGMIKYDIPAEDIIQYVTRLEDAIKVLHPIIIYIDQEDIEFTFKKAVCERPSEWSKGFIDYYTDQGYGKSQALTGLDGTIQILQARRVLETEIYKRLKINKMRVDNSRYDKKCKDELKKMNFFPEKTRQGDC